MSDIAIRAENLSKLYRVGQYVGYQTLRDSITGAFTAPFRRRQRDGGRVKETSLQSRGPNSSISGQGNYIWALKDISFEVKQGEAIGIIGRNGAGKTTLLKLLCRITYPTEGYAEVRGRVGSLLEVGTGFHPELTGRENIYLNGAVLGMKKVEIDRKFDEIVDFSGVEKFLDTPMKRYSSGMQVRLAFSVAAHLEPEILLVDEVLAVGDAAFQKKCLGRMGDITREGRTVLFVSHNMAAITNLCQRGFLIESGELTHQGPATETVHQYLNSTADTGALLLEQDAAHKGDGSLRVNRIKLADANGNEVDYLQSGSDSKIILEYASPLEEDLKNVLVSIAIDSLYGERICVLQNDYVNCEFGKIGPKGKLICCIPNLSLAAGLYQLTIFIMVNGVIADWIIGAARLRVERGDYYNSGKYPDIQDGKVLMKHHWLYSSD